MSFPLSVAPPSSLGLDAPALDRLQELITRHLAEGRYPGAQIAMARDGKLALFRTFGDARLDPARVPAREDSLWLLYSNTKVITASAIWVLAEQGALRFTDRVAEHVPGFEANGKGDITIVQLLSHQSGFPSADVPKAAWEDHELLRRSVSGFTLEWTPGSRVYYHGRAAHWVAAVLIEALTKTDYRAFIREQVIEPLGLGDELFVGLPDARHERATDMHEPAASGGGQVKRAEENNPEFRRAGTPGGGGYASARAMAAFYQMLAGGGTLNGKRLLSPRMVQYVTRSVTGERVDGYMGMPMHRGARAARARHHREHPGAGDHRLAPDVRPRRGGLVLLLGRPGLGSLVRVPDQQPASGSLAQRSPGRHQQRRPLRDPVRALSGSGG
jgi:CubicO group peptidase (beta-lactamase class C family)